MSDFDQIAGRFFEVSRPCASVPTSAPSGYPCNRSGVSASFATLLLLTQLIVCCIHRLNPQLLCSHLPSGTHPAASAEIPPPADTSPPAKSSASAAANPRLQHSQQLASSTPLYSTICFASRPARSSNSPLFSRPSRKRWGIPERPVWAPVRAPARMARDWFWPPPLTAWSTADSKSS